ncbi:hypothetical protein Nmel_000125 [Mimus melanotis]
MKEMSCFCLTFSSLLEQMVKAYKYVTGIFSVTHSSEPQVSEGDKKLTKMDVSVLEEQYDHIKQKQKLQPHIIVYKTGGHESVLPESIVNPVLINKKVKRSKSYRGDVPVRKVTLETINGGNSEDDLLWRIHLGTHRLGQAPEQGDSSDPSQCNSPPWSFDNQRLISQGNGTPQTKEMAGAGGHESVLPESIVNPVLINKKVKRSKSYRGDVPVRKVTLETINGGNSEDDLLWRIHLGTHRLGQAPEQGDSSDPSQCNSPPWSFDNQRLISQGNGTPQTKEMAGAGELSELRQLGSSSVLNSLSKENGCNISSSCQKPPLKSDTAAFWAYQQISATKCMSACNKVNFYPFPNRKGPRISEAARRLGLYVSQ